MNTERGPAPADHAPADHAPADHAPADHAPAEAATRRRGAATRRRGAATRRRGAATAQARGAEPQGCAEECTPAALGPQRNAKLRPVRSRPLVEDLVWKTTGKEGSTECTREADDFIAVPGDGYTLRVEQMGRGSWWWQVYTPAGNALADGYCATSKADAFALAELVYKANKYPQP